MIILLLILALIALWAVVLGPSLLERRKTSPSNSIVAFNNRLGVLASTQEPLPETGQVRAVIPQHRPPTGFSGGPGSTVTLLNDDGRPVDQPHVPLARQSFPPKATTIAPMPVATGAPVIPPHLGAGATQVARRSPVSVRVSPAESAQRLRRKQILQVLVGAAGGTFVLGLLPGMRLVLLISLVFIGLLGGYVYLLLQWKQNQTERTRKVRHLRTTEMQGPAGEIIEAESDLRLVAGDDKA
ncbi:MAG: hypothetical protein DCC49_08990 [Acidobacteria bacterium]|nr:MAG: hypothetical protein DCC49_08990 [Acidobacteriota bacterium]